jgi:hypothetical protein
MFKSELLQPLTQVSCDYCVDATMDMQHPYTLDPCSTSVYEFQFTSSQFPCEEIRCWFVPLEIDAHTD